MLMYGTTMFVVEVVEQPRVDARLWASTGVAPGTYNLAAGMATSGALTGWVRDISGGVPFPRLVEEAAALPPGAEGLVVLPYFAGERTPIFDTEARGLILGLTLRHGRGHLYRAMLEGTAFALRHNFEVMGEGARRLVAVGGGTRGGLWTQIVSDVTRQPQELPAQTIGAAYGDAWLAGIAAGLVSRDHDWTTIAGRVEPDSEAAAVYDRLYEVYRSLYPATREQMHALAALQTGG
jgi:xylulokinase